MQAFEHIYNGQVWRSSPTVADNNSFFHSAFGTTTGGSEEYFDKHAEVRRLRWAAFFTYYKNETMPTFLVHILTKCFCVDEKYKQKSVQDKNVIANYISDIITGKRDVSVEEIPILATLENVEIVVISDLEPNMIRIIKPNPQIFDTYFQTVREKPKKEVVLHLKDKIFSKLNLLRGCSVLKFDNIEKENSSRLNNNPMKYEKVSCNLKNQIFSNCKLNSVIECPVLKLDSIEKVNSIPRLNSNAIKYEKIGSAGSKGVEFQVGLLTVSLLNALRKFQHWKLSTENKQAGKFDDIVLEWSEGAILVQAKFKETRKKISFDELTSINSNKSDFSLPKYYFSFQEVKTKYPLKNIIICTNADIAIDDKFLRKEEVNCDSILYHENIYPLSKLTYNFVPYLKQHILDYYDKNCKTKDSNNIFKEDDIKEFIEHLQFYCNYPSEGKLHIIIEKLICQVECVNSVAKKPPSILLFHKMMDWFQERKGVCLTKTHANAMVYEIRSDKYCEMLEQFDVFFQDDDLCFQDSKAQMFHVTTKHITDVIKIYRSLQNNKTEVLYMDADSTADIMEKITEVFQLPRYIVLIIIWPKIIEESIINKLQNILQSAKHKKVVLVTACNGFSLLKDTLNAESFSVNVTMSSLSNSTQHRLFRKKNIIFQGKGVSLEELFILQATVECTKFIDCDTLEKIIQDETVRVGKEVQPLDKLIDRYYVVRKFKREREIIYEKDIIENNEKIILISDSAGMGKSTGLTKLANNIKNKNPHLWVIKLDLHDYTGFLKHIVMKDDKTASIVELLNYRNTTRLTTHFENAVFTLKEKVVLMMDGVDEISPDYKEIIQNLLNQCQLQSNFSKIFVSTKPHISYDLEQALKVKSFTLEPFNELDQIDYLVKYWSHNLKIGNTDEYKCERYAKILLTQMVSFSKDFATLPLQLSMLAEIFQENHKYTDGKQWQSCKEYLFTDEAKPKCKKISMTELYHMFVEIKKEIFLNKANSSGNAVVNSALIKEFEDCLTCHKTFALEEILNEKERKLFSYYQPGCNNMESNMLRIGIVQKRDSKIHFIYRTFAEYFVAESLFLELKHQNPTIQFQKFFIQEILIYPGFKIIRAFLNGFLMATVLPIPTNIFHNYQRAKKHVKCHKGKYLLHTLARDGLIPLLQLILDCIGFKIIVNKTISMKYLLKTSHSNNILELMEFLVQSAGINIENTFGETPLHCAVEGGHLEMVQFLIQLGADINKYINELLECAVASGYLDIVKFLVEQGVCIEKDHIISCIINGDNFSATVDIASYLLKKLLEDDDFNENVPIVPYASAYLGKIDILMDFVNRGMNVNSIIENGESIIFAAVRGKQSNIIKYLVQNGAEINWKNGTKKTPLQIAALSLHLDVVKVIVEECKADINRDDNIGQTALHWAALKGQSDIVQFLVESDANIDAKDKKGRTPLHWAVYQGRSNVVRYLIERKANINIKDNIGKTILHWAVYRRSDSILRLLLENNVNINVKDNEGETALHKAASWGPVDILCFLLESDVDIHVQNNDGQTALHLAAYWGHKSSVQLLVEHNADINTQDKEGCSALHWATSKDHSNIIRFLIRQNTNINLKDNEGQTPLHWAAYWDLLNSVQSLVEGGADVNIKNNKHHTPLHTAALINHSNIVQYLIDHNVDVNIKDNDGQTPLHIAVCWSHTDNVRIHLASGADVNIQNNNGCTPLHLAVDCCHFITVQHLMESEVDINIKDNNGFTALHFAVSCSNLNIAQFLIDYNAFINDTDRNGQTPLHLAATFGPVDLAQLLVKCSADVHIIDITGDTALHLAAYYGHLDIIRFLIECNANVNAVNNKSNTALHYASMKGFLDNIRFLIEECDVDVSIKNMYNQTALDIATSNDNSNIVEYFSDYYMYTDIQFNGDDCSNLDFIDEDRDPSYVSIYELFDKKQRLKDCCCII